MDSETAKEIHANPQKLNPNEATRVEFKLSKPLAVEEYSQVPALGRFVLEKNNKNVAAGIILEKQNEAPYNYWTGGRALRFAE